MKCSKDAKRKFVATYRKRANSHPIRVRHPNQPLHSSPCSKSHFFTNLQPRKLSIQIPLREIVASLSRGYEHLQLDTTSPVALRRSGGEFRADTADVVDDERLESFSC